MRLEAGIFLTEKWISTVTCVSNVSDIILLVKYWFKVVLFKSSQFMPYSAIR